ncbi:MAG: thiamine phosphate synthase [Bacteroidales bacterium]|nr:thiamine phosphate synthase [Bacteroidales bacterium]
MIVITSPGYISDEADKINSLFEVGIRRLHLRKPDATSEDVARLVAQIDEQWYDKISVHYHFDVAEAFSLGGVHLSGRTPDVPKRWMGLVSASCHTLEEIEQKKEGLDYCFLSPIFDSISKVGYGSAFSIEQLQVARDNQLIDSKVIALGGVSEENLDTIKKLGFGGYAILGALWRIEEKEKIAEYARKMISKW